MDNVLLVIGASSDMGLATICNLKNNYDCIVAHYLHMNENLQLIKQELGDKLVLIQADLSIEDEVLALISQIKDSGIIPSHIVHFPAQKISVQKFPKIKWEHMECGMHISLKSLILILQAFLPQMAKKKYGKVIVILSYVLDGMPPKYSSDYVMIKYALLGLVKALAVEYADKGITINGISPAFTNTRFVDGIHEYIIEENKKASPIGRNLDVEDIIPTIAFMLSNGSDCINGQNISISCGRQ